MKRRDDDVNDDNMYEGEKRRNGEEMGGEINQSSFC